MNVREEMEWLYEAHKARLRALKRVKDPRTVLSLMSNMADLLVAMATYDAAQELQIQVSLELEADSEEDDSEEYANWSEDDIELPGEAPLEPSEWDT